MKILILTQKVDKEDPILGFFHEWLLEFAKRTDKLSVVCLYEGAHILPENVKVLSLGKEMGVSKLGYILKFYKYIWHLRDGYDVVFVHMNPEYVVLGGFLWKILGKKVSLWYTHRAKNLKLWIAEKLSDIVFTSSKYSFTLPSKKLLVLGHGIDTNLFSSVQSMQDIKKEKILLHVGRITKIKNCHVLIEAMNILNSKYSQNFKLKFIGSPGGEVDRMYKDSLINLAEKYDLGNSVEFVGAMSQRETLGFYSRAFASINLAPTGGMDKAVLESLASRVPVFASNLAFDGLFGEYKDKFMFKEGSAPDLAEKINNLYSWESRDIGINFLKEKVLKDFSVASIVDKICVSLNLQPSK